MLFSQLREIASPHPTHKLVDDPMSAVRACTDILNVFEATFFPVWKPPPHQQPQTALCCGDKEIHLTWTAESVLQEIQF
jgi:hypothetical protein